MRLKDRVAIVTGSGTGIGKAIALALSNEGAKVILAARNANRLNEVANEIRSKKREAQVIQTDVSNSEQVKRMVNFAIDNFGKVDILVNNSAAIGNLNTPVSDMNLDAWQKTMAVNLNGTMLCSKEVLKNMIPRRSGNIINISSVAGLSGLANESPYSVSKCGIIGLTEVTAIEVGVYNIRVNCISPGATLTDDFDAIIKKTAEKQHVPYEMVANKIAFYNSLKRMAKPSEIASCVVFLASDESSAVTGHNLVASCGFHMTHPVDDLDI